MFVNETLKNHLETSATIKTNSLVIAEWNMNMPDNVQKLGNYRYRPTDPLSLYYNLPTTFDLLDTGYFYTAATDADILVDGGLHDDGSPQQFISPKDKIKMLFSLEDCIKPFRPRSGVNKSVFFDNKYFANSGASIAQRPRYYMPSRDDQFKYWSSFRTETTYKYNYKVGSPKYGSNPKFIDSTDNNLVKNGVPFSNNEYGIADNLVNSLNYIDDAVPFVVYKESVPANRIIVKMQTNVGDVNLGPFIEDGRSIDDPLFNLPANRTVPLRWKIQYLKDNSWITAYSFNEDSIRENGTEIVGANGYVEIQYGFIIPEEYKDIFVYAGTLSSENERPVESINGYAYLVVDNEDAIGEFSIWNSATQEYDKFVPQYGWSLGDEQITSNTSFVTDFTNPASFISPYTGQISYREFQYLDGIRIVVETMEKFDSTFDLIEMSPRLVADISDKVLDFSITKTLSNLSATSLPVGELLASKGTISLFDDDQSFNSNNINSIISKYVVKNVKFSFFENILDVDSFNYYVPIKTLYSEGFPQADKTGTTIMIELRDFYFYLESMPAPQLLLTQASLSYAVSTLLDYIGFTNYTFKRVEGESDPIIPYFFVEPDVSVAEVLNNLAVSSQYAMFFDEYNNFVIMSRNYLLPSSSERSIDITLSGSNNQTDTGVIKNNSSGSLPNIIDIASQDKRVYNDGNITYTSRYLQKAFDSVMQPYLIDDEKLWVYKPSLLWEVSGTEELKTTNELGKTTSNYLLGAMPINSDLTDSAPVVVNNTLINNVVDFGENIYWIQRYQGYFYANGEVIRYDAVQFNVSGIGNVWISNNQEYQNYFSKIPFNGKIYPTGLVRIYAVPYYETIDGVTRLQNGPVVQHGRAQFGTQIAYHSAGVSDYWSNNSYVRGCNMDTSYLFNTSIDLQTPSSVTGSAGTQFRSGISSNTYASQSTRNSIIKNFMSTKYTNEKDVNTYKTTRTGTIQSSALVMNGPSFQSTDKPIDFVSYVYKNFNNAYKHFGTRMRIIGKIENNENRGQTPLGSSVYYQVSEPNTNKNASIGGGSGGIAVLLNPENNNGYYFEIVALTENNIDSYLKTDKNGKSAISIHNVLFYKVAKDPTDTSPTSTKKAIPVKLWGGLAQIITDDGTMTGQYRMATDENPTVYDLSVEYKDIGKIRRFYLYINNQLIKTVDDTNPLPIYNNSALFVRGSSRCMFEHIYALAQNYSQNTAFSVGQTMSDVFGDKMIEAGESLNKYAMSGIVKSTHLSGISPQEPPLYNMYFEEFGTIMRECAYFDIKYDRSYPALQAMLAPTVTNIRSYVPSGFFADAYGAEFLVFNATDKTLSIDASSGNFLRIIGVSFTQDTTYTLTVDDYFKKRGNLSDPELQGTTVVYSPVIEKEKFNKIKQSRMTYGKNDFALAAPYIQTQDDAESLMGWIIDKVMAPKKSIGVNIFSTPIIQLGDIVNIDYKNSDGIDMVSSSSTRFVVYNIEYSRTVDGPAMTLYLSEV